MGQRVEHGEETALTHKKRGGTRHRPPKHTSHLPQQNTKNFFCLASPRALSPLRLLLKKMNNIGPSPPHPQSSPPTPPLPPTRFLLPTPHRHHSGGGEGGGVRKGEVWCPPSPRHSSGCSQKIDTHCPRAPPPPRSLKPTTPRDMPPPIHPSTPLHPLPPNTPPLSPRSPPPPSPPAPLRTSPTSSGEATRKRRRRPSGSRRRKRGMKWFNSSCPVWKFYRVDHPVPPPPVVSPRRLLRAPTPWGVNLGTPSGYNPPVLLFPPQTTANHVFCPPNGVCFCLLLFAPPGGAPPGKTRGLNGGPPPAPFFFNLPKKTTPPPF